MKGLDGVAVPSDWRRGSAYWEVSRPTFQTSTCVVLPLSPTKYWEMMKDYFFRKQSTGSRLSRTSRIYLAKKNIKNEKTRPNWARKVREMILFSVLCTVYCGRGCVSLESEYGKELA